MLREDLLMSLTVGQFERQAIRPRPAGGPEVARVAVTESSEQALDLPLPVPEGHRDDLADLGLIDVDHDQDDLAFFGLMRPTVGRRTRIGG